MASQKNLRLRKEVSRLMTSPPPGATVWQQEADEEGGGQERLDRLCAAVTGPEDSPYEGGTFRLAIEVPDRYPFEPPQGEGKEMQCSKLLIVSFILLLIVSQLRHQDLPPQH